jgi:hypothetical protein
LNLAALLPLVAVIVSIAWLALQQRSRRMAPGT